MTLISSGLINFEIQRGGILSWCAQESSEVETLQPLPSIVRQLDPTAKLINYRQVSLDCRLA